MLPEDTEVLVVVDRADRGYDDRLFFAYHGEDGNIVLRRKDGGFPDEQQDRVFACLSKS